MSKIEQRIMQLANMPASSLNDRQETLVRVYLDYKQNLKNDMPTLVGIGDIERLYIYLEGEIE